MGKKYNTFIIDILGKELILKGFSKRDQDILSDKPVIYIYFGNKKIYVGQTKRFLNRHKQHSGQQGQVSTGDYSKVIVIYGELIDSNSLDDIEKQLITFFKADNYNLKDNKFNIINGTLGNHPGFYEKQQKVLSGVIIPLWENDLHGLSLTHNRYLSELRTSILYRYSPFKSLDKNQINILESTLYSRKNTIIYGYAGTGKTVLMTNIVAALNENNPGLKIGVAVKANWKKTGEEIFSEYGLIDKRPSVSNNIILGSPYTIIKESQNFDIIIVDEAHRLNWPYPKQNHMQFDVYDPSDSSVNQLTLLDKKCKQLVLLYDEFQAIRPSDIPREEFKQYINSHNFDSYTLKTQYRINLDERDISYSSDDYVNGLLDILQLNPNNDYDKTIFTDTYKDAYFGVVDSIEELFDYIQYQKNHDTNLTINRVLSGYYKKWNSKGKNYENNYDWEEKNDGENRRWNSTHEDWLNILNSEEEIGSIHAVQGIDLNYVGVIIGHDIGIIDGRIVGIRDNYFDTNGTPSRDDFENNNEYTNEEFSRFVKNIYYVLLTRGIDGIRLYFVNDDFKNYFLNKINMG